MAGKKLLQPTAGAGEVPLEFKDIVPGREPELIPQAFSVIPSTGRETRGKRVIPVCEPTLGGNELEYVANCVKTSWISSAGKYISEFEELFARKCGAKYGVACANGTVALHLALTALDIGANDEVIIPTFTMIATANAVTYTGAKPVLVDSGLETWNMDVSQIEGKITPQTKAIMVMHTYGHPVDMEPVWGLAEKYDLWVIEDAAEAHGAEYKGQRVGSLGDAGCFSFYANKIITTGEGGMVTTNNRELAELMANLRDHAFSEERHFWHKYLGYNYRMTNLQAAVGLAQTEHFDQLVQRRRLHAGLYKKLLEEVPGITLPVEKPWARNVFWMFGVLVDELKFGMSRDQLRIFLAQQGIETRTFFIPIHVQPIYYQQYKGQRYPIAERLCQEGMYLPSASSLTEEEIEYICNCVKEAYRGQ